MIKGLSVLNHYVLLHHVSQYYSGTLLQQLLRTTCNMYLLYLYFDLSEVKRKDKMSGAGKMTLSLLEAYLHPPFLKRGSSVFSWSLSGGNFTLVQGDEILIASPNFPNNYPISISRTWRFAVDAGCTVQIDFQEIQTEPHIDTVEIGDGSSEDAQETLSGSQHGVIVNVTDESAWVKFRSDGSVVFSGFRAFVRPVCSVE